jgi:LCP family protein required for cell wall assembly
MAKRRGGSRLEGKHEPERDQKSRRGLKVFLVILTSLLLLAAGVFIWYRFFFAVPPPLPGDDGWDGLPDELGAERFPEGMTGSDRNRNIFTVLIIGLDGTSNTDTIMVASFDNAEKKADIISIPRDTLVDVTRRNKKINAAYAHGRQNGGGMEGGVMQLRREVKTLFGFIPDYYVVLNMRAFERIIDAVGGVDINVPFDMKYTDPRQDLYINISKGQQTLNGAEALKFVRYRRGDSGYRTISDNQRIENQQTVIKALLERLMRPSNIVKMPEFIGIFSENVTSDLSTGNLTWFGEQIARLQGADALSTHTLPIARNSGRPNWYEIIDPDAALELINRTVNPFNKPIEPSHVSVLTSAP